MATAGSRSKYTAELRPALQEELGLGNVMQVPRLEKIVLNCGVGQATAAGLAARRRASPTSA